VRTDDLVELLARGPVSDLPAAPARRYAGAAAWAAVGALLPTAALLGVRPDLGQAAGTPMFWVKVGFVASIAAVALPANLRLARPGVRLGALPALLAAIVVAMWVLAAVALARAPEGGRAALVLGETWRVCPLAIAGLAAPGFVAFLWAMRGLAPTRPARAGAAAGLLAGALAATAYTLHCPESQAPFLAVWYLLGILAPAAAGALAGPRLLRW